MKEKELKLHIKNILPDLDEGLEWYKLEFCELRVTKEQLIEIINKTKYNQIAINQL